jgi:hypothetical protein
METCIYMSTIKETSESEEGAGPSSNKQPQSKKDARARTKPLHVLLWIWKIGRSYSSWPHL